MKISLLPMAFLLLTYEASASEWKSFQFKNWNLVGGGAQDYWNLTNETALFESSSGISFSVNYPIKIDKAGQIKIQSTIKPGGFPRTCKNYAIKNGKITTGLEFNVGTKDNVSFNFECSSQVPSEDGIVYKSWVLLSGQYKITK